MIRLIPPQSGEIGDPEILGPERDDLPHDRFRPDVGLQMSVAKSCDKRTSARRVDEKRIGGAGAAGEPRAVIITGFGGTAVTKTGVAHYRSQIARVVKRVRKKQRAPTATGSRPRGYRPGSAFNREQRGRRF